MARNISGVCVRCGSPKKETRFCSRHCYHLWQKETRKKEEPKRDRCLECGASNNGRKTFCSIFCHREWHRQNRTRKPNRINEILFKNRIKQQGTDDCWLWTGAVNQAGYGIFTCHINSERRHHHAHRVAFFLHFGVIIPGMFILHYCNNRLCCNPSHLYPGNGARNMMDVAESGIRKGEKHHKSKLTNRCVNEIRRLYASQKTPMRLLARQFKVHIMTISNIIGRKTWTHI